MTSPSLQGHTIWVTGAARRIGRAIALACAQKGARIVVHYNTSPQEAEETAEAIHTIGGEAYLVQADLTSLAEIETAVAQVTTQWPAISALIHNAAVFFPTPFGETTEEDWDMTIGSNLKGPYFLTQALLPALARSAAPKVVLLGDRETAHPAKRLIPYAISKEGLRTFAEGLRTACPQLGVYFIEIGPTLPSEDTRLKAPRLTQSVDEVVAKVLSIL